MSNPATWMISAALRPHWLRYQAIRDNAHSLQTLALQRSVRAGCRTRFGRDHDLHRVRSYDDYRRAVPVRSYDQYANYIEQIARGDRDVLLSGKPKYWARTGGTTGPEKLIPVYGPTLLQSRRTFNLVLALHTRGAQRPKVLGTNILLLGSCSALETRRGLPTGFMSSIMAREMSALVSTMILPGSALDHIPAWQDKIARIFDMMRNRRMSIFAGMPPWLTAFFHYVVVQTGRSVLDIWPDISLILHSGVAVDNYRTQMESLLSCGTNQRLPRFMNAYGASEGNFAFQDDAGRDDMLLVTDDVFYEFIPSDQCGTPDAARLQLSEVEIGRDYAIVLTTPGGLRSYLIGDTVRFTQTRPYRIVISGRVGQSLNVAGEKVSIEHVSRAGRAAAEQTNARIAEFVVCPGFVRMNEDGLPIDVPGHKWYVEFESSPTDRERFVAALDTAMCAENPLYAVRRNASYARTPLLARPQVVSLPAGTFQQWLARSGREGGHYKVRRFVSSQDASTMFATKEI